MPLQLFFSITLLLILPARSQWGDFNTEKILSHINTIVLADFQSSHSEDGDTKGVFKIKEILKGRRAKVGEVVTMWDTSDLVAGPVVKFEGLTKGPHLILIYYLGVSKDDKKTIVCTPANETSSVLPIIGGKVPWPREFTHGAKEFSTDLKEVRKQVGVVAKAEAKAYAKGVAKAKAELEKGELNYDLEGSIHSQANDSWIISKAKEIYGIKVRWQTETLYDAVDREELAGYQDTMIAHFKKKFGHDPFLRLQGF
ncbi:hypothetical protein V2O64_14345 [Verrucomicrobiaceae bacterium 227]